MFETTCGTSLVAIPPLWDYLVDGVLSQPRNIPKPWASLTQMFRDRSASQEFNIHPRWRTAEPLYKPRLGTLHRQIFAPSRPRIAPEHAKRPQTSISGSLGRPGALPEIGIIRDALLNYNIYKPTSSPKPNYPDPLEGF